MMSSARDKFLKLQRRSEARQRHDADSTSSALLQGKMHVLDVKMTDVADR